MPRRFYSFLHVLFSFYLLSIGLADDTKPETPVDQSQLPAPTPIPPDKVTCYAWDDHSRSTWVKNPGAVCGLDHDQACSVNGQQTLSCVNGVWQVHESCNQATCRACRVARYGLSGVLHFSSCNVSLPELQAAIALGLSKSPAFGQAASNGTGPLAGSNSSDATPVASANGQAGLATTAAASNAPPVQRNIYEERDRGRDRPLSGCVNWQDKPQGTFAQGSACSKADSEACSSDGLFSMYCNYTTSTWTAREPCDGPTCGTCDIGDLVSTTLVEPTTTIVGPAQQIHLVVRCNITRPDGQVPYANQPLATASGSPPPVSGNIAPRSALPWPVNSDIPTYRYVERNSEQPSLSLVPRDEAKPPPTQQKPYPIFGPMPVPQANADQGYQLSRSKISCTRFDKLWDRGDIESRPAVTPDSDCNVEMSVTCSSDGNTTLICDGSHWKRDLSCDDSSCGICGISKPGYFTGQDLPDLPSHYGNPSPRCEVKQQFTGDYPTSSQYACAERSTNATGDLPLIGSDCDRPQLKSCTVADDHPVAVECNLHNKWIATANCTNTCHVCGYNGTLYFDYPWSLMEGDAFHGDIPIDEAICDWDTTSSDLPFNPSLTPSIPFADETTANSSVLFESSVCLPWSNVVASNAFFLGSYVATEENSPCKQKDTTTCNVNGTTPLRCNGKTWVSYEDKPDNSGIWSCNICGTVPAGYYPDENDPRLNIRYFQHPQAHYNLSYVSSIQKDYGRSCAQSTTPKSPEGYPLYGPAINSSCPTYGSSVCTIIDGSVATVTCLDGIWQSPKRCDRECTSCMNGVQLGNETNGELRNQNQATCEFNSSEPLMSLNKSTIEPRSLGTTGGTPPPAPEKRVPTTKEASTPSDILAWTPDQHTHGTSEDPEHPREGGKGQPIQSALMKRASDSHNFDQGSHRARLDPRQAPASSSSSSASSSSDGSAATSPSSASTSSSMSSSQSVSASDSGSATTTGASSSSGSPSGMASASSSSSSASTVPYDPKNPNNIPDWQCFPWPWTLQFAHREPCDVPGQQACNKLGNATVTCQEFGPAPNSNETTYAWIEGPKCNADHSCATCTTGTPALKVDNDVLVPAAQAFCDFDEAKKSGKISALLGDASVVNDWHWTWWNQTQVQDVGAQCSAAEIGACSPHGQLALVCAPVVGEHWRLEWMPNGTCLASGPCYVTTYNNTIRGSDSRAWMNTTAGCQAYDAEVPHLPPPMPGPSPPFPSNGTMPGGPMPTGSLGNQQNRIVKNPAYNYPKPNAKGVNQHASQQKSHSKNPAHQNNGNHNGERPSNQAGTWSQDERGQQGSVSQQSAQSKWKGQSQSGGGAAKGNQQLPPGVVPQPGQSQVQETNQEQIQKQQQQANQQQQKNGHRPEGGHPQGGWQARENPQDQGYRPGQGNAGDQGYANDQEMQDQGQDVGGPGYPRQKRHYLPQGGMVRD